MCLLTRVFNFGSNGYEIWHGHVTSSPLEKHHNLHINFQWLNNANVVMQLRGVLNQKSADHLDQLLKCMAQSLASETLQPAELWGCRVSNRPMMEGCNLVRAFE